MAAGCTAGGIAAFIACPTEVLKVRAQASVNIPSPFFTLIRDVGGSPFKITNFYEGGTTTVVRAMSIGIAKMAVYNEVKEPAIINITYEKKIEKKTLNFSIFEKKIFFFEASGGNQRNSQIHLQWNFLQGVPISHQLMIFPKNFVVSNIQCIFHYNF